MQRSVSVLVLVCFILTGQIGACPVYAQGFSLPAPGVMVHLSPSFNPPLLKGLKVHADDPLRFDFIFDQGDSSLSSPDALRVQANKLIKYFLASLTIPEKDLWVNLSPYEKDRIVPESFGQTEMGRDLLVEDYLLKQITASLIYPEDETGKKFWKRVYEEASKKFGTTDIPVNTFNKVWIVPEKAVVYENTKAGTAYVVESKFKVMLEQDYLALSKSSVVPEKSVNALGSQIVRENSTPTQLSEKSRCSLLAKNILQEIVIPELTQEVNEGKNFTQLRQVYNSLILATWYKKKIKDSIFSQVYANKNKIAGVNSDDPQEKEKIYQQYLKAFKKGVYNYIKEESDPDTNRTIPRKYFSGGITATNLTDVALTVESKPIKIDEENKDHLKVVGVRFSALARDKKAMLDYLSEKRARADQAMTTQSLGQEVDFSQRIAAVTGLGKVATVPGSTGRKALVSLEESLHVQMGWNQESFELSWRNENIINGENAAELKVLEELEYAILRRVDIGESTVAKLIKILDSDFDLELKLKALSLLDQLAKQGNYRNKQALSGLLRALGNDNSEINETALLMLKRKEINDIRQVSWENASKGKRALLEILETLFFKNPEQLTLPLLERMYDFFKDSEDIKYFLFYVATRPKVTFEVKAKTESLLAVLKSEKGAFFLHDQISHALKSGPKQVLIIHNMKDGQGDEIVRIHTFLQALLDYNPDLQVTVITQKGYLYDHPRVKTIDVQAINVGDIFNGTINFDVVVDHFDGWPYRVDLEDMTNAYLKNRRENKNVPFLYIKQDRRGGEFLIQKVDVKGESVQDQLHLNQSKGDNVYEPAFRLLAELGLPFRIGEENNAPGNVDVAIAYPKAEQRWAQMMRKVGNTEGQPKHPAAIFSPFGGEGEFKGASNTTEDVQKMRQRIHALIASGFVVVLLPNGRPWGNAQVAENIASGLSQDDQRHFVIGPQPDEDPRFFKYFVSYANEVVTVEGGLMHLSYILGQSVELDPLFSAGFERWIPIGIEHKQATGDFAMKAQEKTPGGIDLTPDMMDVQTPNSNGEIKFHLDPAMLEQLQNASGFVPVIINIQLMTDLKAFLESPYIAP